MGPTIIMTLPGFRLVVKLYAIPENAVAPIDCIIVSLKHGTVSMSVPLKCKVCKKAKKKI